MRKSVPIERIDQVRSLAREMENTVREIQHISPAPEKRPELGEPW
jgi:hypothetical protein